MRLSPVRQGLLAVTAAALLAGCAAVPVDRPLYRVDTFAELATRAPAVDVEQDPYTKVTFVEAERVATTMGADTLIHSLRAALGGAVGAPSVVMRVKLEGPTWAFLDRAYDRNGTRFNARQVSRDIVRGAVEEVVAVELDRDYLVARRDTGLDLKVLGRRGEFVLTLPPTYVRGFLAKYDETMRGLAAAPSSGR